MRQAEFEALMRRHEEEHRALLQQLDQEGAPLIERTRRIIAMAHRQHDEMVDARKQFALNFMNNGGVPVMA